MEAMQHPEIVVFDEQEEVGKENDIFVFDDEEENIQEELSQEQAMSHKDFNDCCSRLQDRIIFSNLKNFHQTATKPTTTFFQDARNKRRESERQRQSQRDLPRPLNSRDRPSLHSELPKDVKVDFIPRKPSTIVREHIEESLRDELPILGRSACEMQGSYLNGRGEELRVEQEKEKSVLKVSNFRQFLYTQLKPGYQVSLLLQKTDSGLFSTTYKCFFPQNGHFVLAIQKSALGDYIFSSSQVHISEDHISCLAKMEVDFMGKEYRLYDSGEDCSKTKIMENYKKQMAHVCYSQDRDHPRSFNALISTCDNQSTDFTVIDRKADKVLHNRWEKGQRQNMAQLNSRQPILDRQDGTYKLDFQGLAGVPSVKNFIMESQAHPDALIFGRQDKDSFLMRVKAPFSLLQAIAVALSSIHFKFL